MRRFFAFALATTALLVFSAPASAETVESFDEALARAEASGRPLVVDFFADWCGPCKRFTADYQGSAESQAAFGEMAVLFKIDAEKGEGIDLARRYDVNAFPSFALLNAEGELMDRWVGYGDLEGWMDTVRDATTDPMTREDRLAAFRKEPQAEHAFKLGQMYATESYYGEALAWLRRARELDPTLAGVDAEIFMAMAGGNRRQLFTLDQLTETADALIASNELSNDETRDLVYQIYSAARRSDDIERYVPYIEVGLKATEGATDDWSVTMRGELEMHDALYVAKDEAKAFALKKSQMPEGWEQNSNQLNSIAWWCFENEIALAEARTLAARGVELAEDDQSRANVMDTLAEICNLSGDCGEAVALMRQALELDPDNEYFQKQLARFEELLGE